LTDVVIVTRTCHGSAPNWALMILGVCAVALVVMAGPLF
jgi:hypothetical protein